MTRSQLITKVANDTGISAVEVEKIMDGIFGTIGDVLKAGDKVTIAGFGRFEMRERQTKNFTNPKTKVTSQLEPTAIPGFKRPPEGKSWQVIAEQQNINKINRSGLPCRADRGGF